MSNFIKAVDWRKFNKIMGIISSILIFVQISNNKIDWTIMIIIPLIALLLLLRAYTDFSMRVKPKPVPLTVKELRMKKLKKINKLNKWRFLKIWKSAI